MSDELAKPQAEEDPDESTEESSSGSETESDTEEEEDTGLTENQNRLLYMIDLYTHKAEHAEDKDEWIRKNALLVLIYEGIVANVLDYDYAPASDQVGFRRKYFNFSQEGKSDVEFLREEELLNGLQVSTRNHTPLTCFQISEKGKELVRRVSRKEKEAVHEFVYARGTRELLRAEWDGNHYFMQTMDGSFSRKSSITDCEDVSYVSSAYVPQCLRYGGRPTLSNAHRAHECGSTTDNIRDELDEVITLNSVSIIVAEYIPFGANQIVQLNNNLGSTERCQGGFISPVIDEDSADTQLEMSPELTSVDILDYTLTNHINFEAEIRFQEDHGVVQVETFGVSVNAEGTCFYGMQIEAVMDRIKDNISLDHMARLLVDVHMDSSSIIDSIISPYQRQLMQLIFLGDASHRNKVNLIIANEITPHLTAEEYMDKGEYENELKQVLGDTKAAYDISEHDTLIFGAHGLLIAGPNSRHHEPLLCAYLQFITIDIFVQNYFSRVWILSDDMDTTAQIIDASDKDPTAMKRIRYRLCRISKDIIQLEEILGYLLEALDIIEIPPEPPEQAGRSLYERLEIAGMRSQLLRRTTDLKKNINGAQRNLEVLREMSAVVSEQKMFHLNESLDMNTKKLCTLHESNEQTATSLKILQVVFAGSLAFNILDRVTGDWTVVNTTTMKPLVEAVMKNYPWAWFAISMLFWVVVSGAVGFAFQKLGYKSQGLTTLQIKFHRKIFKQKLWEFIATKEHSYEERFYENSNEIVRYTYEEADERDWGGTKPRIQIEYDEGNEYLLTAVVQYNRRWANKHLVFSSEELREKLVEEFKTVGRWNVEGEDHSSEDLAADKQAALAQRELSSEGDEDAEGGEGDEG